MNPVIKVCLKEEPADLVLKNGKIVNVYTGRIMEKDLAIKNGIIAGIGHGYQGAETVDLKGNYVLPGLIDAHLHIESSMITPSKLSELLLAHGVTGAVVDPHEIVNASGEDGLDFMLESAGKSLIDYYFMIPSSVPATDCEHNGAGEFHAGRMQKYLSDPKVLGLAEAMRFEDVISGEPRMQEKLDLFESMPIDGHAPGLCEECLQAYRIAGVMNDHEAVDKKEAIERIENGFQLFIREGSGAKNLKDLLGGLLEEGLPLDQVSFCTDDKHIEEIIDKGTMDDCLRLAVSIGCDPIDAIRMASINTARHYHLVKKGAVAPGMDADFWITDSLSEFPVLDVYKNGISASSLRPGDDSIPDGLLNTVHLPQLDEQKILSHLVSGTGIELVPGQLLTKKMTPDFAKDNLLVSVERYGKSEEISACYVRGFHLENGALASSCAHDSHNIIAAGSSVKDLLMAIRRLEKIGGGYVVVRNGEVAGELALQISGLMSTEDARITAKKAEQIKKQAKEMGVEESIDPFAALSFLSLPVIPDIRLIPQGVFDVTEGKILHD